MITPTRRSLHSMNPMPLVSVLLLILILVPHCLAVEPFLRHQTALRTPSSSFPRSSPPHLAPSPLSTHDGSDAAVLELFHQFVQRYHRVYAASDLQTRYANFRDNLSFINARNSAANSSVRLAVGPFADLSSEEFVRTYLGGYLSRNRRPSTVSNDNSCDTSLFRNLVPKPSLDWRESGVVTAVKDQGNCGACWAFSAVAAMESRAALSGLGLKSLSEQQLLDCTSNECDGGWPVAAFQYVQQHKGLCLETDYTFLGRKDDYCQSGMCTSQPLPVTSYGCVPEGNETALAQAVNFAPMSIGIAGSSKVFQHYSSGILSSPDCGDDLDHAVLLIGYGVASPVNSASPSDAAGSSADDAGKFWWIKNSWGLKWGIQGYAQIAMGNNQCGIAQDASFPVM